MDATPEEVLATLQSWHAMNAQASACHKGPKRNDAVECSRLGGFAGVPETGS